MTGKVLKLIPGTLLVVSLLFLAGQAHAKDNMCAECHISSEIAAFGNVMAWDRSIFQEKGTICPGVFELKKEAFFTESRLVKYDEFLTELEAQTRRYSWYMKDDLTKQGVKYADLAAGTTPVSIASIAGPNLKIKKSMHEIYEKINKLRGDDVLEYVLGFTLFGTLLLSLLLAFGLKNTLKE